MHGHEKNNSSVLHARQQCKKSILRQKIIWDEEEEETGRNARRPI